MEKAIIVLLLEDDPTHADLIKKRLHDYNRSIVVEHVSRTEEFFDLLTSGQKYNLIVLNYDLPKNNGSEVVRKVRKEYKFKKPIIMLLSTRYRGYAEEVIKVGSTRCLIKTDNFYNSLPIIVEDCLRAGPEVRENLGNLRSQSELVHFTMDGQDVEGYNGETILEVARRCGIKIPTLCYHPSVSKYGACRICVVEVTQNKETKLETSCVFPISEGIDVKTSSERVLKSRRMLLELLIARCPNVDVLIEMSHELGLRNNRFNLSKNADKCILCGLCVRVCKEIVGAEAIGFSQRFFHREISTPFWELSDACTGCGECAKICPTGAITLDYIDEKLRKKRSTVAVKCDGCAGYKNKACIINCPTGALEVVPLKKYLSKHKLHFNTELRELLGDSADKKKEVVNA